MDDVARLAERIIVFDRGCVAMDGTPEEVFTHASALGEIGLSIPKAAQLACALKKQGVPLPDGIFTHERRLRELRAVKEGRVC